MSPLKKIFIFLLLTFSISALSYVPIIRAGSLGIHGGLYVLTLMYSPGLAAILTQLIATCSLRGMGWRLGSLRWLGIAYVLPALYALPVYALTWLAGLGRFSYPIEFYSQAQRLAPHNIHIAALMIFLIVNFTIGMLQNIISALGEEIGWRGLLVPELARVTSFTNTALISGIVWAAWHMPLILLADYNNHGVSVAYSAACFFVMIVATSFPFAWLRLKSGSLWVAVLLHASHNLFVQAIFDQLTGKTSVTPYIIGEFGIGLALTSVLLACVIWRMQKQSSIEDSQDTMSKLAPAGRVLNET